jgi:hypothetical protein
MTTNQHRVPAAQTLAEVMGLSTRRSNRASAKRVRHEQWEQRIERDWQGHFETLRQCICELLIKNQHLRTELMEADKPSQE